jgi:REP element-mobilizing transposase RayT
MQNFDYATPGAYFFTVCLREREPIFGTVRNGEVVLSDIGQMIVDIWNTASQQFPFVDTDAFVVMPDHIHGICVLEAQGFDNSPVAFPRVMQWFKSVTTIAYGKGVAEHGWPRYAGKFWQQDYFERYLRNEGELDQKREYIRGNPGRWDENRH